MKEFDDNLLREFIKDFSGVADGSSFEGRIAEWSETPGIHTLIWEKRDVLTLFGFSVKIVHHSTHDNVIEVLTPNKKYAIWVYESNRLE